MVTSGAHYWLRRLFSHRLSIYARERKSERSERGDVGGVGFASEANKKSSPTVCTGVQLVNSNIYLKTAVAITIISLKVDYVLNVFTVCKNHWFG